MSEEYKEKVRLLFNASKRLFLLGDFEMARNIDLFATNEYLCGTENKNADEYVLQFYNELITVDGLITELIAPKEGDLHD